MTASSSTREGTSVSCQPKPTSTSSGNATSKCFSATRLSFVYAGYQDRRIVAPSRYLSTHVVDCTVGNEKFGRELSLDYRFPTATKNFVLRAIWPLTRPPALSTQARPGDDHATRRPRLTMRWPGSKTLRKAARALSWEANQDPPRTTRRAPG